MAVGGGCGDSSGSSLRPRRRFHGLGTHIGSDAGLQCIPRAGKTDPRSFVAAMLPSDLKPEQFDGYPPEGRKIVGSYLATLRQLPLSFLPALLRELISYDFKFSAERKAHEGELEYLSSLPASQLKEWFQGFAQIRLSKQLEDFDWVQSPAQFVERLSAFLWSTQQLDSFRQVSNDYADRLRAAVPPESLPIPRLGISVIGQGVASYSDPLFRKLRAQGAYYAH